MDIDIETEPTRGGIGPARGLAVTLAEAARLLSVSTRTIHRLARTGKLRIVRITADTPRVLITDIEAFLASCDVEDVAALL